MGDSSVLWETIGQKMFITVPKVTKSLLSQKQSEMQYLSGMMFSPQSRLLSLVPGAQAQLPSRGTSPGGSATRKGGSSAASGCFLLNQKNHQLEQLLSLRMRKPGEMTGAMKSLLYNFPKYFRLSKVALRKLHLFLSTYACENRFSTITDKD